MMKTRRHRQIARVRQQDPTTQIALAAEHLYALLRKEGLFSGDNYKSVDLVRTDKDEIQVRSILDKWAVGMKNGKPVKTTRGWYI